MKTLLCISLLFACATRAMADSPPTKNEFSFTDAETGTTEIRTWTHTTWRAEFRDSKGRVLYVVGGPWKLEGLAVVPKNFDRLSDASSFEFINQAQDKERMATYVEKTAYASVEDPKLSHLNEVRRYRIVNTTTPEKVPYEVTSTNSNGVQTKSTHFQVANKVIATMLCPLNAVTGHNYKLFTKP